MRYLWDFIVGLWNTWLAFVTGGVLAALLTFWPFHSTTQPPPKTIISACASLYFFVAAFIIWKKERQRAEKAEGPFFAELYADVMRLIALMDGEQVSLLHSMAVTGAEVDTRPHNRHIAVNGINAQTEWLQPGISGGHFLKPPYRPVFNKYFVEHPLSD